MSPPSHHEPFKSLGPLAWEDVERNTDSLPDLLSATFKDAQILVDSIPVPATVTSTTATTNTGGRARAKTESAVAGYIPPTDPPEKFKSADPAVTAKLTKEWKEVKVNPKDNPLGISMYKLGAKDGKGAWFARRSLHHGLSFDKWRLALEREFAETLNRSDRKGLEPGTGNIRGIGAEKRVEREVIDGRGSLEMFQVSARFPGPTTPRDFITLLLMSPTPATGDLKDRKPRQFMLVSRPCTHPDCPPRTGFIRGQYESVEVIREIPIEKPLRKTRSSIDMSRDELKAMLHKDKDAVLKAANNKKDTSHEDGEEDRTDSSSPRPSSPPPRPSSAIDKDKVLEMEEGDPEVAIEWLMVTRSDPGGSVPRFLVEKGTPGGIANDANKFVQWLSAISIEELAGTTTTQEVSNDDGTQEVPAEDTGSIEEKKLESKITPTENRHLGVPRRRPVSSEQRHQPLETSVSAPQGFYGMISGALGAATSVVANTVAAFTGSTKDTESEGGIYSSHEESDSDDDTSSEAGYVSAEDWGSNDGPLDKKESTTTAGDDHEAARSIRSTTLSSTTSSTHLQVPPSSSGAPTISTAKRAATISSQHEKELRKLQERRQKTQEKLLRAQERRLAANGGNDDNNATTQTQEAQLAKLREKHEKEIAKQEAKYQRELKKLEEKRRHEERKAEEKRRKLIEREERANTAMELERVKAERDVALKEIEILKGQVGDLQSQNTQLVAVLGKAGLLPGFGSGNGNGDGKGGEGKKKVSMEV